MISKLNLAIKSAVTCCHYFRLLALLGSIMLMTINSASTDSSQPVLSYHDQQFNYLQQRPANPQQQFYHRLDDASGLLLAGQQRKQLVNTSPGHYDFEVAPKMEPPSVRKPPYQQSAANCPGADPFAGFSPKDTLCGDLNQGWVPLNPLGQSVTGQAYPFELIKNKTLQFLARALPVLKLEYETIPKVARYLPPNYLLNPTHQSSPLASEHFSHLNQKFAGASSQMPSFSGEASAFDFADGSTAMADMSTSDLFSSGYMRRKRSTSGHQIVAELSSNATLVVSSAHSSPSSSRIGSSRHTGNLHLYSHNASSAPLAVVTKDGYRPVAIHPVSARQQAPQNPQPQSIQATQRLNVDNGGAYNLALSSTQQGRSSMPEHSTAGTSAAELPKQQTSSGAKFGGHQNNGPASDTNVNSNGGNEQDTKRDRQQQASSVSGSTTATAVSTTLPRSAATSAPQAHANLEPLAASAALNNNIRRMADLNNDGHSGDDDSRSNGHDGQARSSGRNANSIGGDAATPSTTTLSPPVRGKLSASSNSPKSKERKRTGCADLPNGFTSAICQAASALIEGDRPPAWLQVVKSLSNVYTGASDSMASTAPIWSLLSGLTGALQESQPVSSAKSSSTSSDGPPNSLAHQTKANLVALLAPLASFLTGTSAKDSSNNHYDDTRATKEHQVGPLATAMTRLALAGWASNAITSLVEYFAPSVFPIARSSLSRRKKPFDSQETFVDTPASLAAAAFSQSRASLLGGQTGKQPPTPCPSVEEYISPTFARNYQGAWKYVVQIPHEGYFTQTIQRTSCARQKCEFTEGACHESPRWVSLLVAEIYYPNAIFGQATGGSTPASDSLAASQQLMATLASDHLAPQHLATAASSANQIQQVAAAQQIITQNPQLFLTRQQELQQKSQQPSVAAKLQASGSQTQPAAQDPLQMTDSLNAYNHNLNNAFINAANELGLDPTNVAHMQRLASAHNIQLFQRNGMVQNQAQPQTLINNNHQPVSASAEPRSGGAPVMPTYNFDQQPQQVTRPANLPKNSLFNGFSNDYIIQLAAVALQQNPNMDINDLIASLQLQTQAAAHRRKREVNGPQHQRAQHHHIIRQRSSMPDSMGTSINDIGPLPASQQASSAAQQQHGNAIINQVYFNKPSVQQAQQVASATQLQQQPSSQLADNQQQKSNSIGGPSSSAKSGASDSQANSSNNQVDANGNQLECDGHDKIGCYVVRVYYDWFLVNGSCKCWKTSPSQTNGNSQASGSSSGNSFLRRIFTG